MPQSLSNIIVHLVFSTKLRSPFLEESWRIPLHRYIGGIMRAHHVPLIAINSTTDHIHLAFDLPRTMTVADLVKNVKTGSTLWIKSEYGLPEFYWQQGYGAFSVSPEHREALIRYITNQQEHHRNTSFVDEYRKLLNKHGVDFDERYVWD
jgi:REP element-mobilizing transposase RayT